MEGVQRRRLEVLNSQQKEKNTVYAHVWNYVSISSCSFSHMRSTKCSEFRIKGDAGGDIRTPSTIRSYTKTLLNYSNAWTPAAGVSWSAKQVMIHRLSGVQESDALCRLEPQFTARAMVENARGAFRMLCAN